MIRFVLSAVLIFALAACQSSEERAEDHYQSALALLAEGDLDRATVEFRNVFRLSPLHVDARRSYAEALRQDGELQQAFGQFLRLAEQLPDDAPTRLALSEIAIETRSWEQLQTHAPRLMQLIPEALRTGEEGTRIEIVAVTLAYADALTAEDASARRTAADRAEALLDAVPGNLGLYRVLVDSALRDADPGEAMALVDRALAVAPDNRDLHNTKLTLLAQAEDAAGVGAQIQEMIALYPDDPELVATLLRFHISQGDTEAAEAFLRERIAIADTPVEAEDLRGALVQFVLAARGPEAALAEVDAQIASVGATPRMQMMQASIRFATGDRATAIGQMSDLTGQSAVGTLAEINDAKVLLAGMFVEDNNLVGARRLVGEVLEADATHETALRLEAGWLIEDDRADDAIGLLRRALDEAPNDTAAMSLMARAHTRNGNHELARDFLALAFDASNAAPPETLRYAANLMEDGLYLAAEEALIRALRLQPGNLQILDVLGQVYVAMGDWGRAEGVEGAARRLETPEALALADGLQVARLTALGRTRDALDFLQGLASEAGGETSRAAQIAIVRTFLIDGQVAEALDYLAGALAADPDDVTLLMARGAAERMGGDIAAAVATYEAVTAIDPTFERAWVELIRSEFATGDMTTAGATLDRALAVVPNGANLLWAQASFLEQSGDIDGAIEIYERLYEELPNSLVVANNLASLISTYRTDAESLERAYAVARRLRGTDVPQMMDTYGWIMFRRGDIREARPYLETAAATLTDDPLVQFHYGMVLSASGETEAAIVQLTLALDLAGEDDTRAQFEAARAELERLQTEGATAGQ